MKKFIVAAAVLPLLMSAALAGGVSSTIPVTATIDSSCVFDGEVTPLTFNYDAVQGITNQSGGQSANLYCNFGTLIVDDRHAYSFEEVSPTNEAGNSLPVTYTIEEQEIGARAEGTPYYGADGRYWIVTATADKGRWQPDTGIKEGKVTINVSF